MSDLGEQLDAAIGGPGAVAVGDTGGDRAEVDVVDVDRLGVQVERVRVRTPGAGRLSGRAAHIGRELRPGGEQVVPVEVDERLGGGVLRTAPGEVRGGRFFQVDLDPDGAELGRFRVDEQGTRHAEPFTVTREQLGRMVDTLAHRPSPPDDEA